MANAHRRVRLDDSHPDYEVDLVLLDGIERLWRLPRAGAEFSYDVGDTPGHPRGRNLVGNDHLVKLMLLADAPRRFEGVRRTIAVFDRRPGRWVHAEVICRSPEEGAALRLEGQGSVAPVHSP